MMIVENLLNGEIVNEFDEVVGSYRHIYGNQYFVTLYGNKEQMSQNKLKEKILELELFTVPER